MFNVTVIYKNGEREMTEVRIGEYVAWLQSMVALGTVASVQVESSDHK